MKTTNYLVLIVGILLLSALNSQAQIKIGTNPTTINTSALLEVESANKGVLLPRVALQSADQAAPLAAHVAGMVVYNTATAGTAPNNVVPGFYFNDGARWLNLADLAVTNAKLAADAVTTDKIANGTIKNEDLNKTDIPLSGFSAAAVNVDLGSQNLINVKNPIDAQDAATKKYVDDATAAINTLANGKIYIGDASNVATEVTMEGDVTISNTGITAIGAAKVLTGMIADLNVTEGKLAANAVTSAKIANGTIIAEDIAVGAVTTDQILDGTILTEDIASGGNNKVLVTDASGVVTWLDKNGFGAVADDVTIEGAGTASSKFSVKEGGITTTQILDGTVATIDLADDAVTTAKILNANVTTEKIADANVTNGKLAADAVTTDKIANGTIKNEDLNKTDIPLSGFAAATVSVDLGSQNLINVKNPIDAQDAATKKYVDDATAAINTLESGKIYLGNASNVATEVTMEGDVTISNTGITAIGAAKVLTGMIADLNVTEGKLAANAVTTDKILDGTIITADLANDAVETAKIKDLNVTTEKLAANAVTSAKIADGTIIADDIAGGAVTTTQILDGTILTTDIASGGNDKVLVTSSAGVVSWLDKTGFGAVADQVTIVGEGTTTSKFSVKDGGITTIKIADLNVTTEKLAESAVTSAKIADGTIVAADIAVGAVTTTQILDGTVATVDLADDAVTTAKIVDANVTTTKIADANITTAKIADANITTAKIASGGNDKVLVTSSTGVVSWLDKTGFGAVADNATITGAGTTASPFKVENSGITAIKLATDAVETAKIKNDAVTTDKILNANVTTEKIADANITTAKIASGGNDKVLVTSSTGVVSWLDKTGFGAVADDVTIEGLGTTASKFSVKDGGITTIKIADLNVTTDKLAESAVTSAKIADGTIVAADIAVGAVTTTQILDGTVATVDLADDAVTTAKIVDANVTTAKIADANVTNGKLAADAVTTDKIANGTIKNEDLNKTDIPLSGFAAATASVDLGSQNLINVKNPIDAQDAATKKYVDDATAAINTLANGKIYIGNASDQAVEVTMTGDVTISNAGVTTIGASKVLTGMIADLNVTEGKLAADAVTTAKILDANVTPVKIEAGVNNSVLTTNASGAVTWLAASNTLTATDGQLVSTVNGIASTPAVDVLISADNGLTETQGNVQLGGDLTKPTTITTDGTNTLALEGLEAGANTDKILVVDANGVIKTTNGRNVLEIVNQTANYTVTDTDHTILANLTGGAFTITLPAAAAANKGRVLLIRKTDETNNVLTFSESIKYSETTSFTTLNYLSTIRIQSDGTAWYKID